MSGVCVIQSGLHITFKVQKDFNYYVMTQPGSTVTFESITGAAININKNIWGPGNINLNCSVNINADIGAPPKENISGLPNFTYTVSHSISIP